jgi:hypothetical protein
LQLPCADNQFGESLNPCLKLEVGDRSLTPEAVAFTLESDNQATITMSKAQLGNAKAVRFLLYWDRVDLPGGAHTNDPANSVEWSLNIPKTESSPITPSPSFLLVGDSRTVSFSGGELCATTKDYTTAFETVALPKPSCNGTTLAVTVTTAVTKLPGHKELTLNAGGAAVTSGGKPVTLPIDVLKR